MAIQIVNIFCCKTLQNLPKLGFLVWKYTIWQPCSEAELSLQKTRLTCFPGNNADQPVRRRKDLPVLLLQVSVVNLRSPNSESKFQRSGFFRKMAPCQFALKAKTNLHTYMTVLYIFGANAIIIKRVTLTHQHLVLMYLVRSGYLTLFFKLMVS
jgi:hypothetical protein